LTRCRWQGSHWGCTNIWSTRKSLKLSQLW